MFTEFTKLATLLLELVSSQRREFLNELTGRMYRGVLSKTAQSSAASDLGRGKPSEVLFTVRNGDLAADNTVCFRSVLSLDESSMGRGLEHSGHPRNPLEAVTDTCGSHTLRFHSSGGRCGCGAIVPFLVSGREIDSLGLFFRLQVELPPSARPSDVFLLCLCSPRSSTNLSHVGLNDARKSLRVRSARVSLNVEKKSWKSPWLMSPIPMWRSSGLRTPCGAERYSPE